MRLLSSSCLPDFVDCRRREQGVSERGGTRVTLSVSDVAAAVSTSRRAVAPPALTPPLARGPVCSSLSFLSLSAVPYRLRNGSFFFVWIRVLINLYFNQFKSQISLIFRQNWCFCGNNQTHHSLVCHLYFESFLHFYQYMFLLKSLYVRLLYFIFYFFSYNDVFFEFE